MKKTSLFILGFLFMTSLVWGATTTVDFETEGSGYTPSMTTGSGSTDIFDRTNPNIGDNSTYLLLK